jgi:fibronectin type 3 domain-containing protein
MDSATNAGTNSSAPGSSENLNPRIPFARIAEPVSPPYTDTQTQLGKTYKYSVRSVAQYPGVQLESLDSNFATITPKDVFPPPAPQNLVVAFVPAVDGTPAYMDLSWSSSAATDIAGYNVYRSEEPSRSGTRLNPELLPTPAFRDMNAVPGRVYSYTVTAVDRSGNESPASTPASGSIPAADHQ